MKKVSKGKWFQGTPTHLQPVPRNELGQTFEEECAVAAEEEVRADILKIGLDKRDNY